MGKRDDTYGSNFCRLFSEQDHQGRAICTLIFLDRQKESMFQDFNFKQRWIRQLESTVNPLFVTCVEMKLIQKRHKSTRKTMTFLLNKVRGLPWLCRGAPFWWATESKAPQLCYRRPPLSCRWSGIERCMGLRFLARADPAPPTRSLARPRPPPS